MIPTNKSDDPLGSPAQLRPSSAINFKSIRLQREAPSNPSAIEDNHDTSRPTSVMYSAFQELSLSAASGQTARPTLPTILPTTTPQAARIYAAPSTITYRDSYFLSVVVANLSPDDVSDLITLSTAPSWVPKGYRTFSYVLAMLRDILRSDNSPVSTARAAVAILDLTILNSVPFSIASLPSPFHRLATAFPTYYPDDPTSFWNVMRDLLHSSLRKLDATSDSFVDPSIPAPGTKLWRRPDAAVAPSIAQLSTVPVSISNAAASFQSIAAALRTHQQPQLQLTLPTPLRILLRRSKFSSYSRRAILLRALSFATCRCRSRVHRCRSL
jgi:hypothetical protein